jgi:hypothetical protein
VLKETNKINIGDTVELISIAPDSWNLMESGDLIINHVEHTDYQSVGLNLSKGTTGVFFNNVINSNVKSSFSPVNSYFQVITYSNSFKSFFQITHNFIFNKIKNENVIENSKIIGFDKEFNSLREFNSYLNKMGLASISTPLGSEVHDKKKDVIFLNVNENKKAYSDRVKYSNNYQKYLEERSKNNKPKSRVKGVQGIILKISNQQVTGLSTQYFEFDILASSNSGNAYLDNVAFVIQYNSSPFGTNIIANNSVNISKAVNYNSATYVDPMSGITDDASNAIRFHIGADYQATSWTRHLLPTIPEKLVHVKIKLQNCINSTDLLFTDIINVSSVALYTTTSTINPIDAPFLQYDNVNYTQPQTFHLCPPPTITDLSPKVITAGTGSVLTIKGYGFGNSRGNGQVQFPDADNGGATKIQCLDYIDYVPLSWNDTVIKVIVPSIIDTLNPFGNIGSAGSGIISIKRNDGVIGNSPSNLPLTIKYSIINGIVNKGTSSFRKVPKRLVDATVNNTNFTREFYLDSSITNDPNKVKIIKKALRDWSCATSINWTILGNRSAIGGVQDNISLIYMKNGGAAGVSRAFSSTLCVDPITGKEFVYDKETDIGFRRDIVPSPSVSWFMDTTLMKDLESPSHDFYSDVVHELGHCHQLTHVCEENEMMYFASLAGFVSYDQRKKLSTSPNAIDGGIFVINKSLALTLTNCSGTSKITPSPISCIVSAGLKELFSGKEKLQVYPNPFGENVKISYELNENSEINISVYDVFGKKLMSIDKGEQITGLYSEDLEMNNLTQGVYMLIFQINNEKRTIKIIKN